MLVVEVSSSEGVLRFCGLRHGTRTSCDSNLRYLCSMAQTVMISLPPIRSTLANSRNAQTRRSVVAKWWTTAIERTASRLSSRNGRAKLSSTNTYKQINSWSWFKVQSVNLLLASVFINGNSLSKININIVQLPSTGLNWLSLKLEWILLKNVCLSTKLLFYIWYLFCKQTIIFTERNRLSSYTGCFKIISQYVGFVFLLWKYEEITKQWARSS